MISALEQFSNVENKSSGDIPIYYIEENIEYLNHFNIEDGLEIKWIRPKEIVDDPCLLEKYENEIDGYVISGLQTAKWFPAIITLLKAKDLLHLVIKDIKIQDNYNKSSYNGSFEFSFFENNLWHKIKIDDRLPFIIDSKKNIYCASSNKDEFLPTLLEKAYAKFVGGYCKLQSIDILEGLMNFTGGIVETIKLKRSLRPLPYQEPKSFFKKLKSLSSDVEVLCCTMENKNDKEDTEEDPVQCLLSSNHYYLVTAFATLPAKCNLSIIDTAILSLRDKNNRDNIDMLRLRNPVLSGDWNGPFSVGSAEWESVNDNVRRYSNLTFSHEFEFWMTMKDFSKNLESVILCHIPCSSFIESLKKQNDIWYNFYYHGKYSSITPGGSLLSLSNDFLKNDQYFLEILNKEKIEIKMVVSFNCFDKLVRFNEGCGLVLLKVENNRSFKIHDLNNSEILKLQLLSENGNSSSVSTSLTKGKFVLLPWRNGVAEVEYYIRIYISNKSINFSSLLQEDRPHYVYCLKCSLVNTFTKTKFIFGNFSRSRESSDSSLNKERCPSCLDVNPESAIRMTVVSVKDLEANQDKSNKSSYFILESSNYTYKSPTMALTNNPIWNESFIFYKTRKQELDISLEVFAERGFGFDRSMGTHVFKNVELSRDEVTVPLRVMVNKEWVQTSAKVTVKFKTYTLAEFDSC